MKLCTGTEPSIGIVQTHGCSAFFLGNHLNNKKLWLHEMPFLVPPLLRETVFPRRTESFTVQHSYLPYYIPFPSLPFTHMPKKSSQHNGVVFAITTLLLTPVLFDSKYNKKPKPHFKFSGQSHSPPNHPLRHSYILQKHIRDLSITKKLQPWRLTPSAH